MTFYKVVLTFKSGWNPSVWPFKWKLLSSTLVWYYLMSKLAIFVFLFFNLGHFESKLFLDKT